MRKNSTAVTTTNTKAGYMNSFLVCSACSSAHLRFSVICRSTSGSWPASSDPDQADEDVVEHLRKVAQRLRQVLAALDGFDHGRADFPQPAAFHAVAEIGQPLQDGHAGAHQLLQVKTEVDQVDALDAPSRHVLAARLDLA